MRYEVDFLVIGSGIAGLSYALKVAPYGKVCVLCKGEAAEGSTRYAQGGIAAVMYDSDSFDKHIQDTLVAGDGICDREVVEMTIREGDIGDIERNALLIGNLRQYADREFQHFNE